MNGHAVDNVIHIKTYPELPFNEEEALRYAGGGDDQVRKLLRDAWEETADKLDYKVCYRRYPMRQLNGEGGLDLGFAEVTSRHLARHLRDCDRIVVFAATLGLGIDRLISRYQQLSPAKALMLQGIGAAQAEALCDQFCRDIADSEGPCRPRFSPGFGDLNLSLQREIFAALDPERKIGITLNGSLLMTPSKSVTAIIGICRQL